MAQIEQEACVYSGEAHGLTGERAGGRAGGGADGGRVDRQAGRQAGTRAGTGNAVRYASRCTAGAMSGSLPHITGWTTGGARGMRVWVEGRGGRVRRVASLGALLARACCDARPYHGFRRQNT